ncbi:DUF3800 domain-containing protein [Bacillus sp. UNCCL81]|uniref:DUF3800 domain-containing protein n=1 Tax=Bacillus sp. UNCCL81 TaxID=1502755 RepID=UPI00041A4164|nr:DUF3800 domain-containing protein [Bacillus sp. UNCCL81]
MSWRERPRVIEDWNEEIDSIMSIDENGTTDLSFYKKLLLKHFDFSDIDQTHLHDKIFTVTGVVMNRNDFPAFKDKITTIKETHWENGIFQYKNNEKKVVFHSREIRKKEGPFEPTNINYPKFITDLSSLMTETRYKIFSSSIDKLVHCYQYIDPYHVYNLCLTFVIERYCMHLNNYNLNGLLLLESRGKKEDAFILKHITRLLDRGTQYKSPEHFNRIKGVYFNPKWVKNDPSKSYALLELADLASYPIHKYSRSSQKDLAFESIEHKFYGYPYYNGKGLKKFP